MLKQHFGAGLMADEDRTDEEREAMDAMCLMLQAASSEELTDAAMALTLQQFMWILWEQEERRGRCGASLRSRSVSKWKRRWTTSRTPTRSWGRQGMWVCATT